jgi:cyclopropane fatty-acyl-phospholipid synthase-like methyltransferase
VSPEIEALIRLHDGLDRLGPGDDAFTLALIDDLPPLPPSPRALDLGAGTGAGALLLAERLGARVVAVDFASSFLERLTDRAEARGVADRIRAVRADFADVSALGVFDLLWSEGAAYNLTFPGALAAWRAALAPTGVAVLSELTWRDGPRPSAADAFWRAAYPTLGTEAENRAHAAAAGFRVVEVRWLPNRCWLDNYYAPLAARMAALRPATDPSLSQALEDTEAEIALFRACGDAWGYAFYVLTVEPDGT